MSAPPPPQRWSADRQGPWLIALAGLLVMYVPTLADLFRGVWSTEEQGHGPIVLGISVWLVWRQWPALDSYSSSPRPWLAWALLGVGAVIYVLGRSQNLLGLEVGSVEFMLAGTVLLLRGARQLRAVWFALFFLLFVVPLPGPVVDTLTLPMKMAVSSAAEQALYMAGYPIGRSGVTLQIGPYQLLVADACAGLHTLFSLEAMGLLYLNVFQSSSAFRNIALALLIVPISFVANATRVVVLAMITYHLGDGAGQGFLHGFAGLLLFLSALLLIVMVDGLLRLIARSRHPEEAA